MDKTIDTNDRFCGKIAFLRYAERLKFKSQNWKTTLKQTSHRGLGTTIMCKNNEKNDKFYRKVAFFMYIEMVNFWHQSWKAASNLKPHRGLGTRLPFS